MCLYLLFALTITLDVAVVAAIVAVVVVLVTGLDCKCIHALLIIIVLLYYNLCLLLLLDIGVCFCGAPVIGADLRGMCEKYSSVQEDCLFTLHKENF